MMSRKGFTLVELLVVIVIVSLLAALVLPALVKAMCTGRQGAAEHLVSQLSQAAKNYEFDNAVYPVGDGSGSSQLVAALSQMGPKKISYFDFKPDMLTGNRDVKNPIKPDVRILYYRRNYPNPGADAKNRSSFDIWGEDCNQQAEGVNNW